MFGSFACVRRGMLRHHRFRSFRRRQAGREQALGLAGCESLEPRLLLSAGSPEVIVPPLLSVDASTWDSQTLLVRIDPQAGASRAELAELHAVWGAQPEVLECGGAGLQVIHLAEGV